MIWSVHDLARFFLSADFAGTYPFVREDFFECSSFAWIDLEHAADYLSGFSREETEELPWSLDDLLPLAGGRAGTVGLGMMFRLGGGWVDGFQGSCWFLT